MPIYEFQCTNCGHKQESNVKWSEVGKEKCKKCGEVTSKVHSVSNFVMR